MLNIPGIEGRKKKLRIFSLSELFTEIWHVYQAIFAKLAIPLLVVLIPTAVINAVAGRWLYQQMNNVGIDLTDPRAAQSLTQQQLVQFLSVIGGALVVIVVVSLAASFVQMVLIGSSITYMTSERYLGRSASFTAAFMAVRSRFMPLLGALLVYALLVIGLTVALTFVLFLCGLGLGILAYIGITAQALLVPVIILERVSVSAGLRRAWFLAKRRFWSIVAVLFFTSMIATIFNYVIGIFRNDLILTIGDIAISLITAPIVPIAMTLIYYDARVRFEDLESSLDTASEPNATPATVPSPRPVSPLMEGPDFTNLAILTAGVFVLALVLTAVQLMSGGGAGVRIP